MTIEDQATDLDARPATLDDRLTAHADSLRATLDQVRAEHSEYVSKAQSLDTQAKRIERALNALTGAGYGPGRPTKEAAAAKKTRDTQVWNPKPETVEKVLAALNEHGQKGITLSKLAAHAGLATETTRRALTVLREREQARFAGIKKIGPTSHQKAQHFKPMPAAPAPEEHPVPDEREGTGEAPPHRVNGTEVTHAA